MPLFMRSCVQIGMLSMSGVRKDPRFHRMSAVGRLEKLPTGSFAQRRATGVGRSAPIP